MNPRKCERARVAQRRIKKNAPACSRESKSVCLGCVMRFREYRLPSSFRVVLFSLGAAFSVFGLSLALQWFVYDKWLHDLGPFRITGTSLASILAFVLLWRSQVLAGARQRELQHRLDVVRQMNDKIRNALQIIEVTSYLSQPNATAPIREAVETIDAALREGSAIAVSGAHDRTEEVTPAGR